MAAPVPVPAAPVPGLAADRLPDLLASVLFLVSAALPIEVSWFQEEQAERAMAAKAMASSLVMVF